MTTRKSINIQVQLAGKENVRKQIEEIFTYAKNSKIDIKIGDSLTNLNALKKVLNEIQNDITNINNKNINIVGSNNDSLKQQEKQIEKVTKAKQELIRVSNSNSKVNVGQELKSYESLQQRLNEIKGSMSTISNIKMSTNSIGALDSATITYKNELKQVVSETMKWGEVTNQLTGKVEKVFQSTGNLKINDNIEQQLKSADTLKQKYDNLYKSIMNLKNANVLNNGSFNNSKNNGLLDNFKKIDLSNVEQATKQIKKLQDQLSTGNTNASKTTSLKSLIDSLKTQKKDLETLEVFKNVDVSKVNQLNDSLKQADSLYKRLRNNSSTIASGEYSKVTTNLKDSFKSVDGEVSKLKSADTELNKIKSDIDSLQTKLSTMKTNKIIDESVITKAETQLNSLKNNLNNITTAKAREQFVSMNNEIGKLDKSQNQINRIGKSIETLENSLSGLKGKYGSLVGNTSSVGELKSFEKELNNLKNLKSQLQNGKIIDGNLLTSDINKATNASRNLANSVKQSSSALRLAQQDSISLGGALQNALGKFGIYTSLAITVRKLFTEIREGIEYVKYLDDSFTDMSITMNISNTQFNEMGKNLDEMAKNLGVTIQAVHDIGRIYSNENTNIQEILDKTKPTAELGNISGMNALTVSKNMQDITNQFKLLEEEGTKTSDVFTNIGDILVRVSSNMTYDFQAGIQELSSAVSTAGSVADMSGVSLEKFTAEIGGLIEATGMSGSELATGYKMISARVLQIKSVAEDMGVNDEDMSKAQKALNRLGITIEDTTTGKLKGLDTILEEVGGKWNNLTDVEKQYTSEMLAGGMKVYACVYRNICNRIILKGGHLSK